VDTEAKIENLKVTSFRKLLKRRKHKDKKPPHRQLYQLSPAELRAAKEYIVDLLNQGKIRSSKSPYGAPLFFVKDGDKPLRGVVDYRALNRITKPNNASLPRSDEMFDRLGGARVFSKLDLKTGFHQIRIRPEDIEKTAFNTKYGQFEYLVMPMGLCNGPETFQTLMNEIFYDCIDEFLVVYMDDLLVFSKNEEDHLKHLNTVLSRLKEHELYVSTKKCAFMSTEMEFLGFIVGREGLRMDPTKIKVIEDWPRPESVTEVRSFLGLVHFFRRFISRFSEIGVPLTNPYEEE
jgi:Reverse transcriptase (RNA-dependent DNA polymerase)